MCLTHQVTPRYKWKEIVGETIRKSRVLSLILIPILQLKKQKEMLEYNITHLKIKRKKNSAIIITKKKKKSQ